MRPALVISPNLKGGARSSQYSRTAIGTSIKNFPSHTRGGRSASIKIDDEDFILLLAQYTEEKREGLAGQTRKNRRGAYINRDCMIFNPFKPPHSHRKLSKNPSLAASAGFFALSPSTSLLFLNGGSAERTQRKRHLGKSRPLSFSLSLQCLNRDILQLTHMCLWLGHRFVDSGELLNPLALGSNCSPNTPLSHSLISPRSCPLTVYRF